MLDKSINKRIFIKIKIDDNLNYKKLTIPQKMELIKSLLMSNIKIISKKLKVSSVEFESNTPFKKYIFAKAYTMPDRNHPIICFIPLHNYASELILIRPIGKKRHHIDISLLQESLNTDNKSTYTYTNVELYAIYLMIITSIVIRKKELLLNKEFALLNCHNIKGCITESNKAQNNKDKLRIINKYQNLVKKLLVSFFSALENEDYETAYSILGDSKYSQSDINIILRKKKSIRGHLEIFISLYKLIDSIKKYYKIL